MAQVLEKGLQDNINMVATQHSATISSHHYQERLT